MIKASEINEATIPNPATKNLLIVPRFAVPPRPASPHRHCQAETGQASSRRPRRTGDEIRHLLRAAIAAALAARRRIAALSERARPGRAGRPAGLRLRLGSRASFPRGVFALALARGLSWGSEPAHQTDPPLSW